MQEHPTTDSESLLSPIQVLGTPTTATSGRSPEFRKGSNPNPVEFAEDLIASGLLPTPNTMEHREIKTPEQIAKLKELSPGGYRNLREVVINELPNSLLPTPVASEGTKAPAQQDAETKGKTGQVWLSNVAKSISNDNEVMLLPTVQVDDAKNTGHNQNRRSTLASEVWLAETTTNWGNFAPAIERWESLTRVAPAPTKPDGKDGNHRLSAEFTEWMMGLPEGWVTAEDIGLKRNDQLKACGNGVVPQQAELALRILLEGLEFESTIRGGGDSDATNSNC